MGQKFPTPLRPVSVSDIRGGLAGWTQWLYPKVWSLMSCCVLILPTLPFTAQPLFLSCQQHEGAALQSKVGLIYCSLAQR